MKKKEKEAIIWVAKLLPIFALIFIYFSVPSPEGLTTNGWKAILIFLLTAYLWISEIIHLSITAMIIILLLFITKTVTPTVALSGFSSTALFLIIIGFGIATGLIATGLDKRIAHEILKYCHTERTVLLGCMFITAFLSMIMSNTTTVILMVPIIMHMIQRTNLHKIMFLLAIAFSANIGGIGFLIGTPANVIASEALGLDVMQWFKVAFPVMIVMLGLLYISFLIYFKMNKKRVKIHVKHKFGEISNLEKRAALITIITIILWITSPFHGLSTVTVGLIGVVSLFLFVYKWNYFQKHTDWGVVFLIGGAISLGNALNVTGAADWIAQEFLALTGFQNPLFIAFSFVVLGMIATQFIQNTATAAIMTPVLIGLAEVLSINPSALVIPMAIGVSMTFLTPPGTAPNAIVYNKAKIKSKEMLKIGLLPTIFSLIIMFILCWILL
jgi:solute carrier family 13 (sodium-dependent dicarboxylate transporter), member 2/3/5